jgi:Rieske Fe-S protein
VAQHWISGRFAGGARRSLSALDHGEGAILQTEEDKLAVYRDQAGSFHAFSPYCPHMQCLLGWNNLEKTWDCACHGSRFAAEGDLLHGPATGDLLSKSLP